jgi:hypothetical protein
MKLFSVAFVTVVLLANLVVAKPVYAADALVVSICNFVAADDKNRLRKKLRSSKVKLRNIYDGVACNGMSLLQFAMQKNAVEVGTYIVKRLPSGKLAKGVDLKWAGDNGFADSAITTAIKERINQ